MKTTTINQHAVNRIDQAIGADQPVVMLNLVRYKKLADYGELTDLTACTGEEAYLQRYAPAFNEVAAVKNVTGVRINYVGIVKGFIAGPEDWQWDAVVLVEYPNMAAFRKITESPEYKALADHHRNAALLDWRLIATVPAS